MSHVSAYPKSARARCAVAGDAAAYVLGFEAGDVIRVTSKCDDEGWYIGELNNQSGYVNADKIEWLQSASNPPKLAPPPPLVTTPRAADTPNKASSAPKLNLPSLSGAPGSPAPGRMALPPSLSLPGGLVAPALSPPPVLSSSPTSPPPLLSPTPPPLSTPPATPPLLSTPPPQPTLTSPPPSSSPALSPRLHPRPVSAPSSPSLPPPVASLPATRPPPSPSPLPPALPPSPSLPPPPPNTATLPPPPPPPPVASLPPPLPPSPSLPVRTGAAPLPAPLLASLPPPIIASASRAAPPAPASDPPATSSLLPPPLPNSPPPSAPPALPSTPPPRHVPHLAHLKKDSFHSTSLDTGISDLKAAASSSSRPAISADLSFGSVTLTGSLDSAVEAVVDVEKQRRLRVAVLQELIETERMYISDIETLVNVFVFPMKMTKVRPDSELSTIFSNVEDVLPIHQKFFETLVERFEAAQHAEPPAAHDVQIADIMTRFTHYFKLYSIYAENQPAQLAKLEECEKNDQAFINFLKICHGDPKCKGLFLSSFLIKPVQRLCKYPLLLRELIKNTPTDHPDYEPLNTAQEKVNTVVAFVNEAKRYAEGQAKMKEIEAEVGIAGLCIPDRLFRREGELGLYSGKGKPLEPRYLYLFNDLILLMKVTKIDKVTKKMHYEMRGRADLDQAKVINIADDNELGNLQNGFEITLEKKKFILAAKSVAEKNQWLKDIKECVKEFQKIKFRRAQRERDAGAAASSS